MNDFINWCNNNQGFLTLILSFLTILVSIMAIIVSIRTARLPYLKRILLSATMSYIAKNNKMLPVPFQIQLTLTNIGNCPICIHKLALGYKYKKTIKQIYNINEGNITEQIVSPSGTIKFNYSCFELIDFLKTELENSNIMLNTKLLIFARDTEGRTYKKIYKTVEEIIELPQVKISF